MNVEVNTGQQRTITLPDVLKFVLPAQHAVTILAALAEFGPYKAVQPVIANFEQQVLGQQLRPQGEFVGPPPGAPTEAVIRGLQEKLHARVIEQASEPIPTPGDADSLHDEIADLG